MMRCVVCHLLVNFLSCENERSGKCGNEIDYEALMSWSKSQAFSTNEKVKSC